ncbi:hypothetical protein [Yunchengibacter salinarum]|uniref:hypothetical protein n=1 Tax=Yunchengibacter salinarum TaxID=3133399 RepID=UPI0035B6646E
MFDLPDHSTAGDPPRHDTTPTMASGAPRRPAPTADLPDPATAARAGTRDGRANVPGSAPYDCAPFEQHLFRQRAAEQARLTTYLAGLSTAVASNIDGLLARDPGNRVDRISRAGHARLANALHNEEDRLAHAATALWRAEGALARFRRHHGLSRPAKDGLRGARRVAVLAAATLMSGAALFLALCNNLALAQPLTLALALLTGGGTSLAAQWIGARSGRRLLHRDRKPRLRAIAELGGFLTLTLTGHGLLARFHSAHAAAHVTPVESGVGSASLPVILVGMLVTLTGLLLGARGLDDPYPGYGRTTRARTAAARQYRHAWRAAEEAVDQALETTLERLIRHMARLRSRLDMARHHTALLATERRAAAARLAALDRDIADRLTRYRQANIAARSTAAPLHWSAPVTLPNGAGPGMQTTHDPAAKALARLQGQISGAEARMKTARESLRHDRDSRLNALENWVQTLKPAAHTAHPHWNSVRLDQFESN